MVTVMDNAMLVRSRLPPLAGVVHQESQVPENVAAEEKLSAVRWAASMICLVIVTGARECKPGPRDSSLCDTSSSRSTYSGSTCTDDEESVTYQWSRSKWGTVFKHGNHYCCPKSQPIPLQNCHWVGKGDCADNTCNAEEVTLTTDNQGDTYYGCACKSNHVLHFRSSC